MYASLLKYPFIFADISYKWYRFNFDIQSYNLMLLQNPTAGLYFIEKIVNTYWKVEVRAVSELDFSAQLMTSDAASYALTEIEGRPTVGRYTYICICFIDFYYCIAQSFLEKYKGFRYLFIHNDYSFKKNVNIKHFHMNV